MQEVENQESQIVYNTKYIKYNNRIFYYIGWWSSRSQRELLHFMPRVIWHIHWYCSWCWVLLLYNHNSTMDGQKTSQTQSISDHWRSTICFHCSKIIQLAMRFIFMDRSCVSINWNTGARIYHLHSL